MSKKYKINEVFYSLQGEGARAGSANVFIRFSNCNLRCNGELVDGIFQPKCDTEFISGTQMELPELVEKVREIGGACRSIIFTGGEPGLSLDGEIVKAFKEAGYYLAIETNGTIALPEGLDWICVSPKTAAHTIKTTRGNEIKIVRAMGQTLPQGLVEKWDFTHWFVSPAFDSDGLNQETLAWCIGLVKANPAWRLSVQQHKIWGVR